jgi:hypothetical protein
MRLVLASHPLSWKTTRKYLVPWDIHETPYPGMTSRSLVTLPCPVLMFDPHVRPLKTPHPPVVHASTTIAPPSSSFDSLVTVPPLLTQPKKKIVLVNFSVLPRLTVNRSRPETGFHCPKLPLIQGFVKTSSWKKNILCLKASFGFLYFKRDHVPPVNVVEMVGMLTVSRRP